MVGDMDRGAAGQKPEAFDQARPGSSLVLRGGRRFLDLLLPPRCLACGCLVRLDGTLCLPCWSALHLLAPPQCESCGLPFEHEQPPGSLCGACLREAPPWQRARAALAYDDGSKGMILRFKHADYTQAAPTFALWMERAAGSLLHEADLIVPVPLHRWRLFYRRYNQAALLAQALGKLGRKQVIPDLLLRYKRTSSQGHLSPQQRRRNVAGAFKVQPRWKPLLQEARVLLVDDVLTSGATLGACSRTLYRAGARAVDVLTLARVLRPLPPK
ncbi:MAG TPA: ComF family protein [Kiloniellales bacterium]|nr:ComF family protein [Kiloniellales bacterium]